MQYKIEPFVRFSGVLNMYPNGQSVGCDHRLFYCLSGSGEIVTDGISNKITAGTVIYWRGGTVYSYHPDEASPFVLEGVNFDFFNPQHENAVPIPPVEPKMFNPDWVRENPDFADGMFFKPVCIKNAFGFRELFDCIDREFSRKKLCYAEYCSAKLSEILIMLIRSMKTSNSEPSSKLVDDVLMYISNHLRDDLSNTEIGAHFGYHANYINRLVVQNTGKSLHSYTIDCRVNKAVQLLQDTDMSISQVAESTGFYDLSGFSKTFRRVVGVSPCEFRKCAPGLMK